MPFKNASAKKLVVYFNMMYGSTAVHNLTLME